MKFMRLNTLFLLLAMFSFTVFTACNNDDDNGEPEVNKPTIKFFGSGDFIANDATVNAGDTVKFSWQVSKGDNDLKRFAITGGPQGGTIFDSSNLSKNNDSEYEDEFMIVINQSGDHKFTFEAWDDEDNKTSKSITITVRQNDQLNSYSAVLMGAQNNANNGSFYATSQDSVYFATGFNKQNDQYIDFIYYHGQTNKATIAAPSDGTVEAFSAYDVQSWDDRNNTKFLALDPQNVSFSNFQKESDINQYRATLESTNNTKANQLSSSDIYAFLTANGKIGAFSVDNINSQGSGTIEITVKVEP